MGVKGEHAAIMASFLDLPEPHKWPQQLMVLEKYTHAVVDEIKSDSQQRTTDDEVTATISEPTTAIEQRFLQNDSPVQRIQASFDMGWQVCGSSTGHAPLVGTYTNKVIDSIVFNKTAVCAQSMSDALVQWRMLRSITV
jgi:hypothetical protein